MPEKPQSTDALSDDAATRQIYDLLAGRGAMTQGAIIADLVARWLAGHIIPGDPWETQSYRAQLLELHIATVKQYLPIADEEVHGISPHTQRH